MSSQSLVQSIMTEIARARSEWTAYPLVLSTGNRSLVDLAALEHPHILASVVFLDGQQLDLGPTPLVQDAGQIILAAGVKEGGGEARLLALVDHFRAYLQLRAMGDVRTRASKIQRPQVRQGVYYVPLVTDFWSVAPAPTVPPPAPPPPPP